MPTVTITPTKGISILLPTRGRPEVALKSLQGLVELADKPQEIEFLLAIDEDDEASAEYFIEKAIPWFEGKNVDCTIYQVPRWGYLQLHMYNNYLGEMSNGSWIVFWNDDAVMQTQGWDKEILKHTGEFKLLAFDTHNLHPYSIFPILPRDWIILFEKLSEHQQTDAWVSQIAYLADCYKRIPVEVLHDRADLTGNNNDQTYQERIYHEGNFEDPLDINHPKFQNLKQNWVAKIVWLRKLLGQDTGWFDQWIIGEVNPWQRMIENDPNKQIAVTKISKEKFQQMGL
jgi:hypothetical protein